MNKVYVCKKCGKAIVAENLENKFDPTCGGEYMDIQVSEESWNAMSEEEKNKAIQVAKDAGRKEELSKAMNQAGESVSNAAQFAGSKAKDVYEKSSMLYENVGDKIRTVAKIVAWIGIIVSCIAGIGILLASCSGYRSNIFIGLIGGVLTAGIGSLVSWVGSLSLYGFGELIVRTQEIAKNTRK